MHVTEELAPAFESLLEKIDALGRVVGVSASLCIAENVFGCRSPLL
jgi:hypothetical protein